MLVIEGLVELGLVVVIAISRMQARIGKNNSSPVYFSGSYFPPTSTTTSHLSIISLSRVRMIARKGGIEKGQNQMERNTIISVFGEEREKRHGQSLITMELSAVSTNHLVIFIESRKNILLKAKVVMFDLIVGKETYMNSIIING